MSFFEDFCATADFMRQHRSTGRTFPCIRCNGSGMIDTWTGRRGEGGKVGPCPRCQVIASKRFCTELARQTFPTKSERMMR